MLLPYAILFCYTQIGDENALQIIKAHLFQNIEILLADKIKVTRVQQIYTYQTF